MKFESARCGFIEGKPGEISCFEAYYLTLSCSVLKFMFGFLSGAAVVEGSP